MQSAGLFRRSHPAVVVAIGTIAMALIGSAHAVDAPLGNMFWQTRSGEYVQTGDGPQTTELGYLLTIVATELDPAHFTSATMRLPDGSTMTLPADAIGSSHIYDSPLFANRQAMDEAFPAGTYGITFEGPNGARVGSATSPAEAYPELVPHLMGTDYTDLQGMDSNSDFTFHLAVGAMLPGEPNHVVQLFLHERATGTGAFSTGSLFADGPLSLTMPAGTLRGGVEYEWSLYDGHTVPGIDVSGLEGGSHFGYRYHTVGYFTTAVPEPGTWMMLGGGLGILALSRRRRTFTR